MKNRGLVVFTACVLALASAVLVVLFVSYAVMDIFINKEFLIGLGAVAFGLGVAAVIFRLKSLNKKLGSLLQENYEVGRILVRRDMELTEANTRLTDLDQNKSEFVSIAAHQLRTPLTGIRWSFDALLDKAQGEITPEQQKIVESGLKSSVRMIELVNDLLSVARIEEGRFGLIRKLQPLGPIIKSIVDRIMLMAEEKGVTLTIDLPVDLPPVEVDQEKIMIAFENVIDNAIKYTSPAGKVEIKVVKEDSHIKITVQDTGIGVPREQVPRLFTKFFRADNALRFQTAGNGLGLYVVKNIIDGHGGSINVASMENKGTTMTITLPLKNPRQPLTKNK